MIPKDLNPNTFYRAFNDHARLNAEARALQGAVARRALAALGRRLAGMVAGAIDGWHGRKTGGHGHGGAAPTAA